MSEETRGRKKKYSVDVLREIATQYIEKHQVGAITASKLATFANELGYDDIKYYHFTRNSEALEDIIQFDNTAGRGKKYTVNDLKTIIEKCCEIIPEHEKLNVTTLVKYAQKLGYTDINTYHLTKEPEIKQLVDALGRDSSLLLNREEQENFMLQHANILKADDLVDAFRTKPLQLKIILRDFSRKYEDLKLDYLNISMQLRKAKEEISELQQLIDGHKTIEQECNYYKKEYNRISKYDALNDKLFMLQRLNEMGTKVNLSEEAFRSLINVGERTDDNLKYDESENWLSDYSKTNTKLNDKVPENVLSFNKSYDDRIKKADGLFDRRPKGK